MNAFKGVTMHTQTMTSFATPTIAMNALALALTKSMPKVMLQCA